MNDCFFMAKIISEAIQSSFVNDISVVELTVELINNTNKTNRQELRVSVWGPMGEDICKYYQIGDYVVIQGHLSLRPSLSLGNESLFKEPELTATQFYSFFLNEKL